MPKTSDDSLQSEPKSTRTRLLEIIWDGRQSPEEQKLVQKLDLHLMTWATYGYFIRLLDSGNVSECDFNPSAVLRALYPTVLEVDGSTEYQYLPCPANAYISGMKEDLNFHGNQYNLLQTFFICGYLAAQIPSQLILTKVRPSWYLPTAELLWTVVTFCFAAVRDVRDVFALRFVIGMLEAPFAVGVITVMGSYYTRRELAKRIAIFYSASYAAGMFSGYLQAGIYRGMDGHLGLQGWRWLFIFCGVISLPGPLFGYYAVPDSPYVTKARWIKPDDQAAFITRMEAQHKRGPVPLSWAKIRKILTHWPIYVMTATLIFHCVATQPLNYFAVWLKSLNRFSVYQVNLFPTAAQALGLVTTLLYSWLSDGLGGKRWQLMIIPAVFNFIGMVIVACYPNYGAVFFGYMINAASWGYWPLVYAWCNEFCNEDAEERAIVIGVAQTFGQAFVAWVPVVILDVGKYAPRFHLGFSILCGVSVMQFAMIFVLRWFVNRDVPERTRKLDQLEERDGISDDCLTEQQRAQQQQQQQQNTLDAKTSVHVRTGSSSPPAPPDYKR